MRIRKPFLATFGALVVFAGYIGLTPIQIPQPVTHSDKILHFFTFFLFTLTFYWSFETSRRRAIHLTLIVVTGLMSVGSEVIQALMPNAREFDPLDIAGNALGSLAALGLCSLYHKRMLERKRAAKGFAHVSGDEELGLTEGDAEDGIELDEGTGPQETGVTVAGRSERAPDLDETLDNWDENAVDDWEEEEGEGRGKGNGVVVGGEEKGK